MGPGSGNSSGVFPGRLSGAGGSPGSRIGGGTSGCGLPGGLSSGGSVGLPGVVAGISGGSIGADIFLTLAEFLPMTSTATPVSAAAEQKYHENNDEYQSHGKTLSQH